jgi:hypothetical protein
MEYILYQQYNLPDYEPEELHTYNTIDEVYLAEKQDLDFCYKQFPDIYIPYEQIQKIPFISWKYANTHITDKKHNVLYSYSEIDDNGWKFIPISSIYEGSCIINRWIEIKQVR